MNFTRAKEKVLVTSPLVAGFIIYFSCRPKTLLYYSWLPFKAHIDFDAIHYAANERCEEFIFRLPGGDAFIYSIPAALFAFSLTCYLKFRYFRHLDVIIISRKSRAIFYFILVLLVSALPELFQLFGFLPGHYDAIDVLTAATACLIALALP